MINKTIFISVITLMLLGLILSYSLPVYFIESRGFSEGSFFIKQLISIIIGIGLMIFISYLDPNKWFKFIGFFLFGFFLIILIIMPFFPESLVKTIGGAKRWINLGVFSITPSEFYKIGFIIFISWSLPRTLMKSGKISFREEINIFIPYFIILILTIFILTVSQNDLGQTIVLTIILISIFILSGGSFKFFLLMFFTAILGFIVLIIIKPYRLTRIKDWILSFDSSTNKLEMYQVSNSLDAINNGGFLGQGIGNGQYKLGFLTDIHTDFVLAGMIEELGLISIILVIFVVSILLYNILKIASETKNSAYYLFCIGASLLIFLSFIINSFGITGIIPVKGIAVPFISYGGSQIISFSILIGIVLMISKKKDFTSM